ncbi:MAG: 1-acyl-sn-glycerol-3-phosphate acyltransferase [Candidatus Alcyoniella australis]|nr:1-acyl-sn-glycerol-3-phosphate acyltransferase [Candidatus Alcyoniella australis]
MSNDRQPSQGGDARDYDLYSAYMPQVPGGPLGRFLNYLFSRVQVDSSALGRDWTPPPDSTIFYAVGSPGWYPFLFMAQRAAQLGLDPPRFSHYRSLYPFLSVKRTLRRIGGIARSALQRRRYPNPYRDGFVNASIERGEAQMIFLKQYEGLPRRFFYDRPDPLAELIKMLADSQRRIIVIPLLLLHAKTPLQETNSLVDLLFGPPDDPGTLRTLYNLLTRPGFALCRLMPPIDLREYVQRTAPQVPDIFNRHEELAYELRREVLDLLNRERRVIQGPRLKSREEIVDIVAHDRDLLSQVKALAEADGKDFLKDYYHLPRRYADEIASDYSDSMVRVLIRILTRLLGRMYTSIEVRVGNLRKVRKMARDMPVIYIPCHKSHIDYLLVSYVLYRQHMIPPHIAAGINLNFWPLSAIFRRGGAFFLRRSFKGQPVYAATFAKYVETLIRHGHNIEFFIEGGRSRVGKLIVPKLGFLSIVLDAFRRSGVRDLLIAPISIDYERIFEERFYLKELAGKGNEGENLGTVFRHRKMILQPQGSVHLTFAEPFTVGQYLREEGLENVPTQREQTMALAQRIAYRVSYEINRVSLTTPASIVAAALIADPRRGVLRSELIARCGVLVRLLHRRGAKLQETVLRDPDWVEKVLALLQGQSLLKLEDDPSDPRAAICYVEPDKRLALSLYRNMLMHHVQFLSLLSLAALARDKHGRRSPIPELFDDFSWLMRLLRYEFIFGDQPRPDEQRRRFDFGRELEQLLDSGLLKLDGENVDSDPNQHNILTLWAGQTASFCEGYYVLCHTLGRLKNRELGDRDLLRHALKQSERLIGLGEIGRTEAASKSIFDNALRMLVDEQIVSRLRKKLGTKKEVVLYRVADRERLAQTTERLSNFISF